MKKTIAGLGLLAAAAVLIASYPNANEILTVTNLSALQTTPITATSNGRVLRLGNTTGQEPMQFKTNTGTCAASGLANDGASCVNENTGNSWIGVFPAAGADVREWGVKGDGVTDVTVPLQAAVTATCTAGIKLLLGSGHYLISSTITGPNSPSQCDIEAVNGYVHKYVSACPAGAGSIIVNSNITALALSGVADTVRGVCFQMATSAGTRTSGAAITAGATTSVSGSPVVEGNSVIFPYDGIIIGGPTTGATQTNAFILADNMVLSPSNRGYAIGPASSGASTLGVVRGNSVACFSANTNSIGFALYDGSVDLSSTDNYSCNYGTAIIPGTANSATQLIGGSTFTGIIGDTPLTAGLLINATTALGSAEYLEFTNCEASSNNLNATNLGALIENTGGGAARVHTIIFSNCYFHGQGSATAGTPIVSLQNDVYDITFTGGKITAEGGGTNQVGLLDNSSGVGGTTDLIIQGVNFWPVSGSLTHSISITGSGDGINITGNLFQSNGAGTEISLPNGAPIRATIAQNTPFSFLNPTVGAASTVTLQDYDQMILSGTTGINTFANGWQGRSLFVVPTGGPTTLSTGGTSHESMCANYTTTNQVPFYLIYDAASLCWWAK